MNLNRFSNDFQCQNNFDTRFKKPLYSSYQPSLTNRNLRSSMAAATRNGFENFSDESDGENFEHLEQTLKNFSLDQDKLKSSSFSEKKLRCNSYHQVQSIQSKLNRVPSCDNKVWDKQQYVELDFISEDDNRIEAEAKFFDKKSTGKYLAQGLFEHTDVENCLLNVDETQINRYCGFCKKYCNLANSKNIYSIIQARSLKMNYVVHAECLKMSNHLPNLPKLKEMDESFACMITPVSQLTEFDKSLFIKSNTKEFYSIIWNFYHPITSCLVAQIDKIIPLLEIEATGVPILYTEFENSQNPMYSPNKAILPIGEFRCSVTFIRSPSHDEPITCDFYFKLPKTGADKYFSVFHQNQGEYFTFQFEAIDETIAEMAEKVNFKFENYFFDEFENHNTEKIRFYSLKSLYVNLPIKKIQAQTENLQPKLVHKLHLQLMSTDTYSKINMPDSFASDEGGTFRHNNNNLNYDILDIDSRSNFDETISEKFDAENDNYSYDNTYPAPQSIAFYPQVSHVEEESRSKQETPQPCSFKEKRLQKQMSQMNADTTGKCSADFDSDILSEQDIKGNVINFACSNWGSRKLQKFLQLNEKNIFIVLDEIKYHTLEIMCDTYGNFMFQTLVHLCNEDQCLELLEKIKNKFVEVACHQKGTHALQELLSMCHGRGEEWTRKVLVGKAKALACDQNATHLLQKVIKKFDVKNLEDILNEINFNIYEIALHPFGVCSLKAIIDRFKNEGLHLHKFLDNIALLTEILAQNSYGNYILQHAITTIENNPKMIQIFDIIRKNLLKLSIHKCSSNIVEKCLQVKNEDLKRSFLKEIFQKEVLAQLTHQKFGTYVLVTALKNNFGPTLEKDFDLVYQVAILYRNDKISGKWKEEIKKIQPEIFEKIDMKYTYLAAQHTNQVFFNSNKLIDIIWKPEAKIFTPLGNEGSTRSSSLQNLISQEVEKTIIEHNVRVFQTQPKCIPRYSYDGLISSNFTSNQQINERDNKPLSQFNITV